MKYYAKFKSPDGEYADAQGIRYDVSTVRRVRSPQGLNVGHEQFPSLAAALEAWGLTCYEPVQQGDAEAASMTAAE